MLWSFFIFGPIFFLAFSNKPIHIKIIDRAKLVCLQEECHTTVHGTVSFIVSFQSHKSTLRRSADFVLEAKKRSEEKRSDTLLCYGCRNTDLTSSSCVGTVETCQPGEVCASIFHTDNTNMDGCLSGTICSHLEKSEGIFARCCSSDFCNM